MTGPRNEMQARRAEELLVQRVTEGLSPSEAAELASLGAAEDLSFEQAVAALDLAFSRPVEPPPQLLERILADTGVGPTLSASPPVDIASARRRRGREVVAWTVAALGFAAAAGALLWAAGRTSSYEEREQVASSPTIEQQRLHLLNVPDAQTIHWAATKDPAGQNLSGDLVWSPSRQEGYAKFAGLAANDPSRTQYQMWIFDKGRDDKFPVDGGVFDIAPAGPSGETIIRISPRLRVSDVALFAVTIERPGGVVVSGRDRIVATAAPKG